VGAVFFLLLLMLLPTVEFVRRALPSKFIRESYGASKEAEGTVAPTKAQPFNVVVHLCLLLTIGSLLKLDLAEVMIASNACILGPPTAAALAASKGWQPLIAPGILVGLFGYAIATFIGVAMTAVLK